MCGSPTNALLRLEIPKDAFRTVPAPERKEAKDDPLGPAVPAERK